MSTNYTSVAKGLKLKVRKFYGLISTFAEVTGEKLIEGFFAPPLPHPPTPSRIGLIVLEKILNFQFYVN